MFTKNIREFDENRSNLPKLEPLPLEPRKALHWWALRKKGNQPTGETKFP